MGIILTDPQMRKEVSKPFVSKLYDSWQPADYSSPHIQTCQQFLIKDLTISDSLCSLKKSFDSHRQIHMSQHIKAPAAALEWFYENSNVWYTLRRIIVSSMNSMGQLSSHRPSVEWSHWTPKGELLMMTYTHCHSSYLHTNSMILTSSTWPQHHVKTDNG